MLQREKSFFMFTDLFTDLSEKICGTLLYFSYDKSSPWRVGTSWNRKAYAVKGKENISMTVGAGKTHCKFL